MHNAHRLVETRTGGKKLLSGNLLHVHRDQVVLPDGRESSREWIAHPGACAVLPVYGNGDVLLIQQYRYPVGQIFYEVPAGKMDPGEEPETTARREIEEEAGIHYRELAYLGPYYPCIGYSNEIIHLYTAWDISGTDENTDDDEFVVPERMPFTRALEMLHRGEITDSKTMISLYRARDWWKANRPFDLDLP